MVEKKKIRLKWVKMGFFKKSKKKRGKRKKNTKNTKNTKKHKNIHNSMQKMSWKQNQKAWICSPRLTWKKGISADPSMMSNKSAGFLKKKNNNIKGQTKRITQKTMFFLYRIDIMPYMHTTTYTHHTVHTHNDNVIHVHISSYSTHNVIYTFVLTFASTLGRRERD